VIEAVWQCGRRDREPRAAAAPAGGLFLEWSGAGEVQDSAVESGPVHEDRWAYSKIWQITRRLLYQNRWIYLFLMLWPFGMAAILLVPAASRRPTMCSPSCTRSASTGLGLVAFTGSACWAMSSAPAASPGAVARGQPAAIFLRLGQRSVAAAGALRGQFCGERNRPLCGHPIDRRLFCSPWPWHNWSWECGRRPRLSSSPPGCP
jgi:hypothetical protein